MSIQMGLGMDKVNGKKRILELIIRRNQIEKNETTISLNEIRLKLSKLQENINANTREYQGLLQIMAEMMGNNQLLDPLLWQERMQYAQELQNINKGLNDGVNSLWVEIGILEKKIESHTAKEKSLERKMISLNNEIGIKGMKAEELVLSDLYAVHLARGL
jgi:hypothetical protein